MPRYLVTFLHARYRATFEVLIHGLTPLDAQDRAGLVVAEKCRETVGSAGNWRHRATLNVEEGDEARGGRSGLTTPS